MTVEKIKTLTKEHKALRDELFWVELKICANYPNISKKSSLLELIHLPTYRDPQFSIIQREELYHKLNEFIYKKFRAKIGFNKLTIMDHPTKTDYSQYLPVLEQTQKKLLPNSYIQGAVAISFTIDTITFFSSMRMTKQGLSGKIDTLRVTFEKNDEFHQISDLLSGPIAIKDLPNRIREVKSSLRNLIHLRKEAKTLVK